MRGWRLKGIKTTPIALITLVHLRQGAQRQGKQGKVR